jgi:hypothetical protein
MANGTAGLVSGWSPAFFESGKKRCQPPNLAGVPPRKGWDEFYRM